MPVQYVSFQIMSRMDKRKLSGYKGTVLIMLLLIAVLGFTAVSPALCDLYADHIYGALCDLISHITSLFPFAVGEILMYAWIIMVLAGVVILFLLIFFRKKKAFVSFCSRYFKVFSVILLSIVLIYILTWFIPFNGTVLGRGNCDKRTDYSYDEIYTLLCYFADSANAAAEEISVSDDGYVEFYPSEKITSLASDAMRDLGDEFPRLSGYYPPVKNAICSDILDRMYIGGYNYPYTMEPTHNRYISPLYQAVLDAHEYAHHKGYYKENEATFLSELALSRSDDPYLRLAAYIELYNYTYSAYSIALDNSFRQMIDNGSIVLPEDIDPADEYKYIRRITAEIFGERPVLSDRVCMIYDAGLNAEQEIYDADTHAIDEMPAVNEFIEETGNTGWQTQSEIIGDESYDGATLLILQYFCDHPGS